MTARHTFAQDILPEDARDTLNSLMLAGMRIANVAAFPTTTVPADVATIIVESYAAAGDAPPCRYRRALIGSVPFEGDFASARADAGGAKWVIAESEILWEWCGAKGDSNGVNSGSNPNPTLAALAGTDDSAFANAAIKAAEDLRVVWATLPGKNYRLASNVNTPVGQRTLLIHGSNSTGRIRSRLVQDGYTNNQGSPMLLWSKGTRLNKVTDVDIAFEGAGCIVFPKDAVKPGTSGRGSITLYAVDRGRIRCPATTATSNTGFQVTSYHSKNIFVDFGRIGLPDSPTGFGDDGGHAIGEGENIFFVNGIWNSGDDPQSVTMEAAFQNLSLRNVVFSGLMCSTEKAKAIKVHADNTVAGCSIKDIWFINTQGVNAGPDRGGGIVVLNELPASNTVENIFIISPKLSAGPLPKTEPNAGTDSGNLVYVRGAKNVRITNPTLEGSSNSMVLFRDSTGGGIFGATILPAGPMPAYAGLVALPIATVATNGNGTRRFTFSGTPDLSPIEAELAATAGYNAEFNNKYPLLTTAGMTATQHQGTFRIVAANNAGKFVDVENVRSNTPAESPSAATGTITLSKTPDLQMIDCQDVTFDGEVKGPLGWTACWVGSKRTDGIMPTDNKVRLEVFDQKYGSAFHQAKGLRTDIAVKARRAKSGAEMVCIPAANGVADQFNLIHDCHDFAGVADATQGYGRALRTDYATDRIDVVRGRTNSRVKGNGTIPTTAAFVNVVANAGVLGGLPGAMIDESWLTLTPTNAAAAGIWATWDAVNFVFVVSLPAAPAVAATFRYKIAPPN